MRNGKRHLSRKAQLKAAQTGIVMSGSHLERCESCRTYFNLLTRFTVVGATPLETPSHELMTDLHRIAESAKVTRDRRSQTGTVVFDSWRGLAPAAYRDEFENTLRRMKLSAGAICLELVAERQVGKWSFVARLYDNQRATSEFAILIGRKKLAAESLGFYQWSSKRPPGRLRLQSDVTTIEFEGITW